MYMESIPSANPTQTKAKVLNCARPPMNNHARPRTTAHAMATPITYTMRGIRARRYARNLDIKLRAELLRSGSFRKSWRRGTDAGTSLHIRTRIWCQYEGRFCQCMRQMKKTRMPIYTCRFVWWNRNDEIKREFWLYTILYSGLASKIQVILKILGYYAA